MVTKAQYAINAIWRHSEAYLIHTKQNKSSFHVENRTTVPRSTIFIQDFKTPSKLYNKCICKTRSRVITDRFYPSFSENWINPRRNCFRKPPFKLLTANQYFNEIVVCIHYLLGGQWTKYRTNKFTNKSSPTSCHYPLRLYMYLWNNRNEDFIPNDD